MRNLSFVPGNDAELCKNPALLKLLARLLVFKHTHTVTLHQDSEESFLDDEFECIRQLRLKRLFYEQETNKHKQELNRDEEEDEEEEEEEEEEKEWWYECVTLLRENTLVTLANIAGHLQLASLDADVAALFSHGLIHWSICGSREAQDPLDTAASLSPQRLAVECLSKMTIHETNVDLVLATIGSMRPYLDALVDVLCGDWLARGRDDETLREFAIVLATAMAKCDQFAARAIAKHVSALIGYIEEYEEQTRRLSHHHHHHHQSGELEDQLGTTVDMLRRCASCIGHVAAFEENVAGIMKHEHRLLELTTSQYVDHKVCQTLAHVLFCGATAL